MSVLTREALIQSLKNYGFGFDTENKFRDQFLKLLKEPRAYHRDHLPGHLTGSAWIVNHTKTHVLLTHHAKLNKWLQPGGHADGDENIFGVALREAEEETGLKNLKLLQGAVFDIDIHTIPARNGFPEHLHYDVRFIFEANQNNTLILTEESHDLQWVSLLTIPEITNNNESMMRMANKVSRMHNVLNLTFKS